MAPGFLPGSEDNEWSSVLGNGTIKVDHALDARGGKYAAGPDTAFRHGDILWRLFETVVVGLGTSVVVKMGISLGRDGVNNLQYINKHVPSVLVPSFLGSVACDRRPYVFMSRGRSATLEAMWPDLSTHNKLGVRMQLSGMLRDACFAICGSFGCAIFKDTRRIQRVSAVPMDNEGSFNDILVEAPPRRTATTSIRILRPLMRDGHAIAMTHADLHPRNIVAEWATAPGQSEGGKKKQCVPASILDWEMAGWYPTYWESLSKRCAMRHHGGH
ncbi:hypothetical protein F503_04051 [Ophiostoma piceae UAMH 11346]|uniref:Aminoglycoside phosphotransferase domain-containing protein n=1 Tax=Ophiostoma piceae (strain UAMH 11346) TaxID=1262450 RepID=S3BQS1_OPHP1|nr:hypothetical protein F503_04051 [Ophiostoma piceae UAMH 11346]